MPHFSSISMQLRAPGRRHLNPAPCRDPLAYILVTPVIAELEIESPIVTGYRTKRKPCAGK
jgi:hypothetical protein